jgi:hypothetical protein
VRLLIRAQAHLAGNLPLEFRLGRERPDLVAQQGGLLEILARDGGGHGGLEFGQGFDRRAQETTFT